MEVFAGLLHDARGGTPDPAGHRALRGRPDGWAVGPLVVGDERLAGLPHDLALSAVTSSGAGGVAALARRAGDLDLVAVESVLRDLDDLPGNAARVVAAAGGLADGVEVYVGLPAAPGLVGAVEAVEAAGLRGRVDVTAAGAAGLLSLLVEADLPFKATGLGPDPFGPYGAVALLMAVLALVDGAEEDEADALLSRADERHGRAALAGWDAAAQARVTRRVRGLDVADVAATLDRLGSAGLLGG